ncbi:MAG TPA: hypothetical protein VG347_00330 [Verrucomicrobiae bacterium]|nr:hypothetical protein [Verrucomicrobiae bacterium]
MKPGKPVAIIDKSLFQEICAVSEVKLRESLLNEILNHYELVIPFVLVEEVWINFGKPKESTSAAVHEMVKLLKQMTKLWMDDEMEIIFKELVRDQPIKRSPPPPKELINFALNLDPNDPNFSRWLEENWKAKKLAIDERVAEQRSLLPAGSFATISSEEDLFQKFIRRKFMETLESPERIKQLLENWLGNQFRHRHTNYKRRIEKAFGRFNKETFRKYPVTLSYILTSMFYFYAPLFRIQNSSEQEKRKIIGSAKNEQRNNITDQQYVVSALLCDRLLTSDEGMYNMMNIFKRAGFWTGETVFIDLHKDLSLQIPKLLI